MSVFKNECGVLLTLRNPEARSVFLDTDLTIGREQINSK